MKRKETKKQKILRMIKSGDTNTTIIATLADTVYATTNKYIDDLRKNVSIIVILLLLIGCAPQHHKAIVKDMKHTKAGITYVVKIGKRNIVAFPNPELDNDFFRVGDTVEVKLTKVNNRDFALIVKKYEDEQQLVLVAVLCIVIVILFIIFAKCLE